MEWLVAEQPWYLQITEQKPLLFWHDFKQACRAFCEGTCRPINISYDEGKWLLRTWNPKNDPNEMSGIQPKLNLSSCSVFNHPDDNEKRVTMLVLKKTGPQGKIFRCTDQFSVYYVMQRLNNELEHCHHWLNQWNGHWRGFDWKLPIK